MHDASSGRCQCSRCHSGTRLVNQWLKTGFLVILIIAGIFLIRNWDKQFDYIGVPETRDTINIEGTGEVTVIPDIATFTIGVQTERPTVAAAQQENTDKMNAISSALKAEGIAAEDIQTSQYNIYPQYNYNDGDRSLRGYQVSQSVTVKVRDLDKVGDLFAQAGTLGANNVGGLTFTVDDPEQFRQEARVEAIRQAEEKAQFLAKETGIKLGQIVAFHEYSSGQEQPYYREMALAANDAAGFGGAVAAPSIETGSTEVVVTVNVSYEVLR